MVILHGGHTAQWLGGRIARRPYCTVAILHGGPTHEQVQISCTHNGLAYFAQGSGGILHTLRHTHVVLADLQHIMRWNTPVLTLTTIPS